MILLRARRRNPTDAWTRLCHFDERMPSFGASLALVAGQLYIVHRPPRLDGRTRRHPYRPQRPPPPASHVHEAHNTHRRDHHPRATKTCSTSPHLPRHPARPTARLRPRPRRLPCPDPHRLPPGRRRLTALHRLALTDLAGFLLSRISERFMALSPSPSPRSPRSSAPSPVSPTPRQLPHFSPTWCPASSSNPAKATSAA